MSDFNYRLYQEYIQLGFKYSIRGLDYPEEIKPINDRGPYKFRTHYSDGYARYIGFYRGTILYKSVMQEYSRATNNPAVIEITEEIPNSDSFSYSESPRSAYKLVDSKEHNTLFADVCNVIYTDNPHKIYYSLDTNEAYIVKNVEYKIIAKWVKNPVTGVYKKVI